MRPLRKSAGPVSKPASPAAPTARATGSSYAAGGDVGDLYDTLQTRFASGASVLPPPPLPIEERIVQAISRLAGWVVVGASFVGLAVVLTR